MINSKLKSHLSNWQTQTEYIIAGCQAALALLLLSLYSIGPKPIDTDGGVNVTSLILGGYLFMTLVGLYALKFRSLLSTIGWFRLVADIVILTIVIFSFSNQYSGSPEATLKAPGLLYFFVLISLQAMRFSVAHVLVAGFLAVICWASLLTSFLSRGAEVTSSYLTYVTGNGILIGAEVEKIIILLIFSGLLSIAVHRARQALHKGITAQLNEDRLRAEAEVLKATNISKAKSDFLAKISHELRTPMNGIYGVVQQLENGNASGTEEGNLSMLRDSSMNLMTIINNILDVTAIENNDIILEEAPVDLQQVIYDIIDEERPLADKKGLSLNVTCPSSVPCVVGDERRIKVVLNHLLNNAIRFTDDGTVNIDLKIKTDGASAAIECAIQDTGPGIPEDIQETIFNLFEQVENGKDRGHDGLGLGLSIAKALTEKMSGHLSCNSVLGKGSIFTFTLSAPIAEQAPTEETKTADLVDLHKNRQSQKFNILVAEDNTVNQMVIGTLLKSPELEISFADDGALAVEAFKSQKIDLILMDLSMPNMDGIEATTTIRRLESDTDRVPVPVLALTAHVSDETRQQCVAAGMNDYLTKPVKKELLTEKIHAHLFSANERAA